MPLIEQMPLCIHSSPHLKAKVVRKITKTIPSIVLGVLILSAYCNTFYSPPILDDYHSFIYQPNVYLSDFSVDSLVSLANTFFGWQRWIPMFTFSLDHRVGRGSIFYFHLTNLIIHLLCTVAVFFLACQLLAINRTIRGESRPGGAMPDTIPLHIHALAIAGIWALNPVQTNAVTYIVQRMASLQALFYLTSVALYVAGRRAHFGYGGSHADRMQGDAENDRAGLEMHPEVRNHSLFRVLPCRLRAARYGAYRWRGTLYYLGAVLSAGCAFLSKENSATLPVMLLATEIWFFQPDLPVRAWKWLRTSHWSIKAALCLGSIVAAFVLAVCIAKFLPGYNNRHFTMPQRLLTEARIVVWYLSLVLWPAPSRLSIEHDVAVSTSFFHPWTTLPAIGLIALACWAVAHFRRRHPLASYGMLWFLVNLAIESTVVPLELIFEHRLYLPSVGVAMIVVTGLVNALRLLLHSYSAGDLRKMTVCVFAILGSCLTLLTFARNEAWQTGVSIYRDAAAKAPLNPRAHANLAAGLGREGHYEEAIKHAERAIDLGKPRFEAYFVAANAIVASLVGLGRDKEAMERGEYYVKNRPDPCDGGGLSALFINLAQVHRRSGQLPKAYAMVVLGLRNSRHKNSAFADQKNFLTLLESILREAIDRNICLKNGCDTDKRLLLAQVQTLKAYIAAGKHTEAAQLMNDFLQQEAGRAKPGSPRAAG